MSSLLWPTINVAILTGVLFKFLREPVKSFVSSRSQTIEKDLVDTAQQKTSAEKQKKELSAKLSNMDAEAERLVSDFQADARRLSEELVQKANVLAIQIRKDAEVAARSATQDLRAQLIAEYGTLLVNRIEAAVTKQLTQDDKTKFMKTFSKLVESTQ